MEISFLFLVLIIFLPIYLVVKSIHRKREARYLLKLSHSGIDQIDRMTGHEFEEYLKALFLQQDYKVTVTPGSGDYGADLILKRDGSTIAVQAKRYSKPVGVKAVQEVLAAKSYYGCTDAWVVSNNIYTKSAHQMAERTQVNLIDREDLVELILKNKMSRVNRKVM